MEIIFVCQAGELEAKAALLAASLRYSLGNSIQLVAAVPDPAEDWGELSPATAAFLRALCVEEVRIKQVFGRRYPIANKIAAFSTVHSSALLLDSDVICISRPPVEMLEHSVMVAAKPGDFLTCRLTEQDWTALYHGFRLCVPNQRITTTVSLQDTLPYFNAGLIYCQAPQALATRWMTVCQELSDNLLMQSRGHWLDQIALPIAIHSLGWRCCVLTETWNFPAHRRPLSTTRTAHPYFVHYHRFDVFTQQPMMSIFIRKLAARYPSLRHIVEKYIRIPFDTDE